MTTATQTWFDITARANFEKHLPHDWDLWRALQLGCFAGDATVWLTEHGFHVTDIDTFQGSDEHDGIDMDAVRTEYLRRTDGLRVQNLIGWTDQWLPELRRRGQEFDFIYIDADHHAAAVLSDAVLAWPLLASGGLMAFDDYYWPKEGTTAYERPANGINAFIMAYGDQFDVVEKNTQLWVRKR